MTKLKTKRAEHLAHVGISSPLSTFDRMVLIKSMTLLMERKVRITKFIDDDINLNTGRDFLKEGKKYSGVILYSIYHTQMVDKDYTSAHPLTDASDRHTIDNWKERLLLTGAKFIVVSCYAPFSLSYYHLSELPGYKSYNKSEGLYAEMTLYTKI